MAKVSKYPLKTQSGPAESKQELMSGAEHNTDPRTINTETGLDRSFNEHAYPTEDQLWGMPITHEEYPVAYRGTPKLDHYTDAAKHPGFKAVQSQIAAKEGVSKDRAGAILAASSRGASAKAKAKNPHLKKVKGY